MQAQPPISVIQLTDTHLGARSGEALLGMDTDNSLAEVLALVEREQPAVDLVLLTGDLSNNGHRAAYERLSQQLATLSDCTVWLPGNHDDPALMRSAAGEGWFARRVDLGEWQVLLLNSAVPDRVGGRLAQQELAELRDLLTAHADQYTLICLHHHVLPIGCDWLDEQIVENRDEFFAVLAGFSNVRMVLSGHVHQEADVEHQGIRVVTSPSTCIQFAPNSRRFALDRSSPGYRWLKLYPDGRVDTGVSRVTGVHFHVDIKASGY